jgi:hypothetical protein
MSVTSSDIKIYTASGTPEDDTTLAGGQIDLTTQMIFDSYELANIPATSGNGTLRYSSTNNADSGKQIVAYGRKVNGSLVNETGTLENSGILATGTQVFERILKVTAPAHNYNILVQDSTGNTILTMESGIQEVRRPFYNVSSSPTEAKTYYDKFFIKNTNATLSLLNASIIENSGGVASSITFSLSNSINDSDTFTNRLTQPTATGADGFSSTAKTLLTNVGVSDLEPGSGIGCYLCLSLPSGTAASKSFYSISISGESI